MTASMSPTEHAMAIVQTLACGKPGTCPCRRSAQTGRGKTHCPGHDDHGPSLSVAAKNDRVVVHCHAGCAQQTVIDALRERGLWPEREPAVTSNGKSGPPATYIRWEYRDAEDRLVAIHVRKDVAGQPKEMWWATADGKPSTDGKVKPESLPLYGLAGLAEKPNAGVVLVEGERAADAAYGEGLVAVSLSGGASQRNFGTALEALSGRRVTLWPDNDDQGKKFMVHVAHALEPIAASVQWLDVPGLPPKGDAADYFATGRTVEELRSYVTEQGPEIHSDETQVVPSESILRFRSAREIADSTPEQTVWIAKGLVAKGAVTEVDGGIKRAGKTTFVTHMVTSVLDGKPFLGQPTRRCRVVYLTEQPAASFRMALARAGLLDRDDMAVLSWHDTLRHSWQQICEAAVAECQRVGAELLVVDTLSQFAGLTGEDENNSGKALEAMRPLQVAAAVAELGVIVVRQDRKGGGEVGESARGSSAFAGAVDIILALRRGDGNTRPTIRVLEGLGRFDDTPQKLMIELTSSGYIALGSESAVIAQETRTALLDIVPSTPELAMREEEFTTKIGGKRSTVRDALKELLGSGELRRIGTGKKNDACRYWRPDPTEIHSDGYMCEVSSETKSDANIVPRSGLNGVSSGEIHSDETASLIASESISSLASDTEVFE